MMNQDITKASKNRVSPHFGHAQLALSIIGNRGGLNVYGRKQKLGE
jgi:hypothetical protein